MQPLNLPPFEANIKKMNGMVKILDVLRQKFVALTPEEWVRQHFVHFLVEQKGYPSALMANEVAVTLNGMSRRCDTVVYRKEGLKPLMIVEYKRPDVEITQRVFEQICRYNMVLEVEWLVVSNGMQHYCCHVDIQHGTYTFAEEIPTFADLNTSKS
ncbi:MAG: type I restriction enzyme HsdR N-terminal domain-containing protein [Bacteroidaceae bacterium]|nr:type I restriction enzyme HsdR N-terminal domain-containing protein [Bacteroidaceae bacterium]